MTTRGTVHLSILTSADSPHIVGTDYEVWTTQTSNDRAQFADMHYAGSDRAEALRVYAALKAGGYIEGWPLDEALNGVLELGQ